MDMTLFQKPQVNLARSTRDRMWLLCAVGFLAVFQSSLGDSFRSLMLAAAVLAGALVTEMLFNLKDRYWSIKDGSAAASAMVLTLLLPNQLHPLFGFLGAAFSMAVIKHSYGGLGSNWANPAAGGWLFIRAAWPAAFAGSVENSPLMRLALSVEQGLADPQGSPLSILKINGWQGASMDSLLSGFFNSSGFSLAGARLPEGYLSFFSAPGPGIIADRGLLFLVFGTMIFTASRSFRLWIPAAFLAIYSLLVRIFGALPFGGGLGNGDMLFVLLSGGTIAAAFMLVPDPATGPKSSPGYLAYILFAAAAAFLFRFPGNEPYGVIPAVLLGNALVPVIRRLENRLYYEKRRKP
ncbi:MAG: RnfABCDGE type electron transport complex subunit D [Treponema sp.]|jgi:electron transport complex protein RnfD|nr:RnfABCDGE type electron transport complex subunit D [Treponema sp.]